MKGVFKTRRAWTAVGLAFSGCLICGTALFAHEAQKISGNATFYTESFEGKTASGVAYDPKKLTAAHRTLPFGTRLRVTDTKTHRSVTVVVNDRGPFVKGRVLDLSRAAALALHMPERGVIEMTATVEP